MASTESRRYRDHRIRERSPEQRKYEKRSHAHYAIESIPKMMVARMYEPKQKVIKETGSVNRTKTGWTITGLGRNFSRMKMNNWTTCRWMNTKELIKTSENPTVWELSPKHDKIKITETKDEPSNVDIIIQGAHDKIRWYQAFAHDLSLELKSMESTEPSETTEEEQHKRQKPQETIDMKTQKEPGRVQKTGEGWLITGLGINLRHIELDKRWPDMNLTKVSENPVKWEAITQYGPEEEKWVEIYETNKHCPSTQQELQNKSYEMTNVMIQVQDTPDQSYEAFAHHLAKMLKTMDKTWTKEFQDAAKQAEKEQRVLKSLMEKQEDKPSETNQSPRTWLGPENEQQTDNMEESSLTPIWIRWNEKSKTFTVLVNANDTILDVKKKIHETENIPPKQQSLIYQPTETSQNDLNMDNERTISSYLQNLEARCSNDNTIELVKMDEEITQTIDTQDQDQTEEIKLQKLIQELQVRQRQEHVLRQISQQEGEKQITVNGENWTMQWGRRGLRIPGKCQICGDTANTMIGIEPEDQSYLYYATCCSEQCAMQHAENGQKWLPFYTEHEYNEWIDELRMQRTERSKRVENLTERILKLLLDIPSIQFTSQEWYGRSNPILEEWKQY